MTDYPYQPPEREFADTILAFRDFELASTWSVRVEPDPLGPVNKIVTLMRGGQRVCSVLCPVPVGASVRVIREEGTPRVRLWSFDWDELDDVMPYWPPGWRVEVDGRTVLTVTDAEMHTPASPPPPVPLWRRMRQALREQLRTDADWIAKRLGYHRDGECGGDW
jgi:hypothetical protein